MHKLNYNPLAEFESNKTSHLQANMQNIPIHPLHSLNGDIKKWFSKNLLIFPKYIVLGMSPSVIFFGYGFLSCVLQMTKGLHFFSFIYIRTMASWHTCLSWLGHIQTRNVVGAGSLCSEEIGRTRWGLIHKPALWSSRMCHGTAVTIFTHRNAHRERDRGRRVLKPRVLFWAFPHEWMPSVM